MRLWRSFDILGAVHTHRLHPNWVFYAAGINIIGVNQASGDRPQQTYFTGHDDKVTAFAMSGNGRYMASGQRGKNSDVFVWDISSGKAVFKFEEHDHAVTHIAFSPDDRLLATVGNAKDGRIIIWDLITGKVVCRGAQADRRFDVSAIAWNPSIVDTYMLATAAATSFQLFTIDPYAGTVTLQPVNCGSVCKPITCLLFTADAQWLYGGSTSGEVVTVNVARRAVQLCHPVGSGGVFVLRMLNQTVMAGCGSGEVTPFTHENMRYTCAIAARVDGQITSISNLDEIGSYVIATRAGGLYKVLPSPPGNLPAVQQIMCAQRGDIQKISFAHGRNDAFATCTRTGSIAIWDLEGAALIAQRLLKDAGAALCIALQADVIVAGFEDGVVRGFARDAGMSQLWSVPNAHSFTGACGVSALAVGYGGRFIATAGVGGELRVWDGGSREMVASVKAHGTSVTSLQCLVDNMHVVSSSKDCTLLITNIATEKKIATFFNRSGPLNDMCLAPDQVHMLSVGLDRSLTFWDIRKPDPVFVIQNAHEVSATCVACHPGGTMVATGGADLYVRTWDFQSGKLLNEYSGHSGSVTCLEFSPDGCSLVSGGVDGDMMIWKVGI